MESSQNQFPITGAHICSSAHLMLANMHQLHYLIYDTSDSVRSRALKDTICITENTGKIFENVHLKVHCFLPLAMYKETERTVSILILIVSRSFCRPNPFSFRDGSQYREPAVFNRSQILVRNAKKVYRVHWSLILLINVCFSIHENPYQSCLISHSQHLWIRQKRITAKFK